jgi:hypothetical protein
MYKIHLYNSKIGDPMKRFTPYLTALLLLAVLATSVAASPVNLSTAPSFTVTQVSPNGYVYVHLYNFPANTEVKVYMDKYGTLAIGGSLVGSFNSSSADEFKVEMATLVRNQYRAAIRLEAPSAGIYISGYFINDANAAPTTSPTTTTTTTTTTYGTGGPVPTLEIVSVDSDKTVTVKTHNFPIDDTFEAMLNNYGTLGVSGFVVDTVKTTSSSQTYTFNIPSDLKGKARIAIRLESTASGYYSYDWFNNYGTGGPTTTTTTTTPTTTTPSLPVGVIPTFVITAVSKDGTVTVQTSNLPANDTFNVYMNSFGTAGVGGTKVDSVSTNSGGTQTYTFNIPSSVKGQSRIAIRMQSASSGYYGYNWFWNSTYP